MLRDEKIKKQYRKWFLTDKEYLDQMWELYRDLNVIDKAKK